MTRSEMLEIVKAQLALDLNCAPAELAGEKDSFVYVEAAENPGRRPFPRGRDHFEMLTMGASIIVSATPALLEYARRELAGKSRDDAFSAPFVFGHSLYYLPDLENMPIMPAPGGYEYEFVEKDGFEPLYSSPGFRYAIQYDLKHPRPDILAVVAHKGGKIVGIAGSSEDCTSMWQIGLDVLPCARGNGLAAYLTNALTHEILRRGVVPYYGTASSNVASQRVAHRAGFSPGWMCAYSVRAEGFDTAPTG